MENYIARCVESIEKQGNQNIEIIIINDGSTDGTRGIIEKLAQKHPNITCLDQANIGLYHARINAVSYAKGEYITFVDADDMIVKNFYQQALEILKRNDYDILEFGIRKIKEEKVIYEFTPEHNTRDGKESIRRMLEKKDTSCSNCNKIYRKSLFEGIPFEEDIRCYEEDKLINVKVMCKAQRVVSIPDIGYLYDTRYESITTKRISKSHLNVLKTSRTIYEYLKKASPFLSQAAGRDYCAHLAFYYMNIYQMDLDRSEVVKRKILEEFKTVYKEEGLYSYRPNKESIKRKVMIGLFWMSPRVTEVIYRSINRFGMEG